MLMFSVFKNEIWKIRLNNLFFAYSVNLKAIFQVINSSSKYISFKLMNFPKPHFE